MTPFEFRDKVAVITGGCGGIGWATTKKFIAAGARGVAVDLQEPPELPENFRHIKVDITRFSQVKACVQDILATEKAIHFLINVAGISRDAVIWKMTEADWDAVLNVNLKGAFHFIHHVAPHFRENKYGKIVNISSINGLRGKFGLANYSASKAGLMGLTRTVAKELGKYNVNVNAIAPGFVKTPLTEKLQQKFLDQAVAETALGRLATPADIANVILFLCSELARHITGEVITVDGGQMI